MKKLNIKNQNYRVKIKKDDSKLGLHALSLIFIKEAYLFVKNLYGLVVHPFKTTGEIVKKPDHSQTILIFGLPFYLWFLGAIVFLPFFWLIRNWYNARILSLLLFYSFTLLLLVIAFYLYYRLYEYYKKCKLKPKF